MNRLVSIFILVVLITSAVSASEWQKYVSQDGSFSFHYPTGWQVKPEESTVEIINAKADEQLLIMAVPFDAKKSPTDLAKTVIEMYKQTVPDIEASNWSVKPDSKDSVVSFELAYTEEGKAYNSDVMLLKESGQAFWFSFSGPKAGYSHLRAVGILMGLMLSMSSGSDSKAPSVNITELAPAKPEGTKPSPEKICKNADAFMFVLEFALGAQLSASEEKLVLGELKKGWMSRSAEELKPYDAYPGFVNAILSANQEQLGELRPTLESAVKEWLNETDQSDPAVKVIRRHLEQGNKVVAKAEPALTEMAAASYSEMMVFAEMLHKNSKVNPDQIPSAKVAGVRKQLIAAWNGFSERDRNNVLTCPALWMTTRQLLKYGTQSEQTKMRSMTKKLYTPPKPPVKQAKVSPGSSTKSSGSLGKPMSWAAHNTLMEMKKITFNTYMWSRGYSGWTPMGKM